jgi:hypothetical protein
MDIKRLYFRNDPIILGKPPNDPSYMRALLKWPKPGSATCAGSRPTSQVAAVC